MEQRTLCDSLRSQISNLHDAEDVIRDFNKAYDTVGSGDRAYYRSLLLNEAKKFNHIDLMVLVISGSDSNHTIPNGVSHEVEDLRFCSLFTPTFLPHKLYVLFKSQDAYHVQRGVRKLFNLKEYTDCHDDLGDSYFVLILKFASGCYNGKRPFMLSEIVQLLIAKGANIREMRCDDLSPLCVLFNEIENMDTYDVDKAAQGRRVMIEITKSLLIAGCKTDGEVHDTPLDCLLDMVVTLSNRRSVWRFLSCGDPSELRSLSYQLLMISELVELMLAHGARPTVNCGCEKCRRTPCCRILACAGMIASKRPTSDRNDDDVSYVDSFNVIMDGIANILRCLFVSGVFNSAPIFGQCEVVTAASERACPCGGYLMHAFLKTAQYSSRKNSSTTLIQTVLTILSENQIMTLKRNLLEKLAWTTSANIIPSDLRATNDALHWVATNEGRLFSLQNICRRAIVRSISHGGGLCAVQNLGLPKALKQYLLLQTE